MTETAPEPTIDLARLDELIFQQLYKQRIEPCFAANEETRVAAVAQFRTRALIGCAAAIVIAILAWQFTGEAPTGLVAGFVVAIVALAFAYHPLANWGAS